MSSLLERSVTPSKSFRLCSYVLCEVTPRTGTVSDAFPLCFATYRNRASYSTCNDNVDVVAPGTNIWSSISDGAPYGVWGFNFLSGTSMAAPFVSGIIAKIWSQCPDCSHTQVQSCLEGTADFDGLVPSDDRCYGNGLVQAEDAYNCLIETEQCCT
jgi:hypothetical protein